MSPRERGSAGEGEVDEQDEVLEELRFHLEMRAADNEAEGMEPSAARRDAEARFGDFPSIYAACSRLKQGDSMVLQRVQTGLLALTLVVIGVLALRLRQSQLETRAVMNDMQAGFSNMLERVEELSQERDAPDTERELARLVDDERGAFGRREVAAPAPPAPGLDRARLEGELDRWIDRVPSPTESWRAGVAFGEEVAALPPEDALLVMQHVWPHMTNPEHRCQSLKAFVFHGGHPFAVQVLHLAATDPDLSVQGWAWGYLSDYAFQDFSTDPALYSEWWSRFGHRPLDEVLVENANDLAVRARELSFGAATDSDLAAAWSELLEVVDLDLRPGGVAGVDLAQTLREAGLLEVVERGLLSSDEEQATRLLSWAERLRPEEGWIAQQIVPVCLDDNASAAVRQKAAQVLGRLAPPYALETLEQLATHEVDRDPDGPVVRAAVRGLGDVRDPRAVPFLIGLLERTDQDLGLRSTIGAGALQELTGVRFDVQRDAAWWRTWWEDNRLRFEPAVSGLEIPKIP